MRDSILDALQFDAKVHESLIVVSLCMMVLYHTRCGLIGSRGVPLGLLSSGFQLKSVAYVFSAEFWGGATVKSQRAGPRVPLVLAILRALALANLAAPSSAITMLPRLDWWSVGELWPQDGITFSAYIRAADDTPFPETVAKGVLPDYCFGDDAMSSSDCPSSGLQTFGWGLITKVRETADDHLELVFEDEYCNGRFFKPVKPGKKYG